VFSSFQLQPIRIIPEGTSAVHSGQRDTVFIVSRRGEGLMVHLACKWEVSYLDSSRRSTSGLGFEYSIRNPRISDV
jgi:hypothetical protein